MSNTKVNCGCADSCCTERASDISAGERMPIFISVEEWLQSVDSRTVSCAEWTATPVSDPNATALKITGEKVDNGNYIVSANISEGQGGMQYQVEVIIETCEGHRGRFCFIQYVKDC